jgi:chaperonin GroEL (HSP60 family)
MYLYGINIYFTNELKDETLHHEGKILKFSKISHFFFPTYEEKSTDFKNEKCFNFLKMDKKNVQIWKVKILLTDEKICLDKKKLSS